MKIAVKTVSQLPLNQQTPGLPLGWPAECMEIADDQEEWALGLGFTVVASFVEVEAMKIPWMDDYRAYELSLRQAGQMELTRQYIQSKITAARAFGGEIMDQYAIDNVLKNKNTSQIDKILSQMQGIQLSLLSGSLYVALKRIAEFVPTADVTAADLNNFTVKIKQFLGIP